MEKTSLTNLYLPFGSIDGTTFCQYCAQDGGLVFRESNRFYTCIIRKRYSADVDLFVTRVPFSSSSLQALFGQLLVGLLTIQLRALHVSLQQDDKKSQVDSRRARACVCSLAYQ